jgi:hypothetical protein
MGFIPVVGRNGRNKPERIIKIIIIRIAPCLKHIRILKMNYGIITDYVFKLYGLYFIKEQ